MTENRKLLILGAVQYGQVVKEIAEAMQYFRKNYISRGESGCQVAWKAGSTREAESVQGSGGRISVRLSCIQRFGFASSVDGGIKGSWLYASDYRTSCRYSKSECTAKGTCEKVWGGAWLLLGAEGNWKKCVRI